MNSVVTPRSGAALRLGNITGDRTHSSCWSGESWVTVIYLNMDRNACSGCQGQLLFLRSRQDSTHLGPIVLAFCGLHEL